MSAVSTPLVRAVLPALLFLLGGLGGFLPQAAEGAPGQVDVAGTPPDLHPPAGDAPPPDVKAQALPPHRQERFLYASRLAHLATADARVLHQMGNEDLPRIDARIAPRLLVRDDLAMMPTMTSGVTEVSRIPAERELMVAASRMASATWGRQGSMIGMTEVADRAVHMAAEAHGTVRFAAVQTETTAPTISWSASNASPPSQSVVVRMAPGPGPSEPTAAPVRHYVFGHAARTNATYDIGFLSVPTVLFLRLQGAEGAPQATWSVHGPRAASAPARAPAASAPSSPSVPAPAPVLEPITRLVPDPQFRPLSRRVMQWLPFVWLRWMRGPKALEQETRRSIYDFLACHPGALAGDIADALAVRRQTVLYHLRILVRDGLVVSKANGRTHYFRRDDPRRADPNHVLTPTTKRLLDLLGDRPMTARQLSDLLGITPRGVSWHLARLHTYGLVTGRKAGHTIRYRRSTDEGTTLDSPR